MVVPLTLKFLKAQWRLFATAHPLARGCISYAVIWPTSSLIQQTIEGRNFQTYDWICCLRYSLFGALYVAPTLYGWVRLSSVMWPQMNLRVGLVKAAVEQISYGPFAATSFFFIMSLLEGRTRSEAVQEVKDKFPKAFETGICIWPIIQTINFSMVPEQHRVVFVSICSLAWTTFLAYIQEKNMHEDEVDEVHSQTLQQQKSLHQQDKELTTNESLVLKVKRAFAL
ncbi:mpv17-like protein [Anastrepha obliqua]|uniref:mpv17-like protein n=1 Tax=Anastrepha obliqua TaxID=95512 RepID=UPI00240A4F28|nr:mpv17-like protein [Anastrepha obliqua]XP_054728906.1 mpv17-like protein [Anastrepha obliqua]XP_054728907.1 mpv17-like protein [Anastrepha obliqua]XP_054728908.1 mpv17-like protein [Anastrepha obliqua]XP_054728909.1 mpv17-like protein [Anastrepha obliqua]XP_054728910.1 mpv17-like protein [Anastrepha obliqua]